MKIKIKKEDILIFIISFLLLNIFLYIFYPGILSYDSYNQLNQIKTNNFSNWHPFFHTFIEMILLKIHNSPAIIAEFQILVFSIIWTGICCYNRCNTKKNFILQIILTLIICLNPINFTYAITLWKDILFSYILLLTCFLIQIIMEKKYNCSCKFTIGFGLCLATLSQIRYNGLYISIIIMIIIGFLFYKNDKNKKNFIILPIITILGICSISSLNYIFDVKNNEKDAIEPKVMQYLTYYLKEDKIIKKDEKIISKVADINKLKQKYKASYTDQIYAITDHKKYQIYKKNLFLMAIKYTIKYPIMFLDFTFDTTSFIWNPLFPKDRIGLVINTDINSENNIFGISPKNINTGYYKTINNIINITLNIEVLKIILYSPALYFYISIFIGLFLLYRKKYNINLIILPNLINLLIIAISNPIHDIRYIYPNILIFYLLLILLFKKMEVYHEKNN